MTYDYYTFYFNLCIYTKSGWLTEEAVDRSKDETKNADHRWRYLIIVTSHDAQVSTRWRGRLQHSDGAVVERCPPICLCGVDHCCVRQCTDVEGGVFLYQWSHPSDVIKIITCQQTNQH